MLTREEHKNLIAGQFILTNPQASADQIRTYADGAVAMYDFLERKRREELATKKLINISQTQSK